MSPRRACPCAACPREGGERERGSNQRSVSSILIALLICQQYYYYVACLYRFGLKFLYLAFHWRAKLQRKRKPLSKTRNSSQIGVIRLILHSFQFLLGLMALSSQAHQTNFSSVHIHAKSNQSSQFNMEIEVKGQELGKSLGINLMDAETGEVDTQALVMAEEQITDYLVTHAVLSPEDKAPCHAKPDRPFANVDDIVLKVKWNCPSNIAVNYRNRLFLDQEHAAIQSVLIVRGTDKVSHVLTAENNTLRLSDSSSSALTVIWRYVLSGIEHIWIGYDHIAFLIALLLWARRLLPVVKVVTAFTVAHSITLGLAVLDVVLIPGSIIEPLIAASIIWVAVENFFFKNIDRRWKLTFLLGLIHGFGFAGVLRDFGLPTNAVVLALASFNIGVEIGQVAIVAIAVPALLALDRLMKNTERSPVLVNSLSAVIAILGLYWLVLRTVFTS